MTSFALIGKILTAIGAFSRDSGWRFARLCAPKAVCHKEGIVMKKMLLLMMVGGALVGPGRVEGQIIPPVQVVSLPPCQTAGQSVEVDVSTGANIPPGQQDPRWEIIAAPPNQTGPFPVFSSVPIGTWAYPPPPSHWIQRYPGQLDDTGNYTYRLQLNLTPGLYSSVQIVGNYAADNSATIELNGVTQTSCAGNYCFDALHPLNITSDFVNGLNILDIIVNNAADKAPFTGLLVQATLQASCSCVPPPPGMVAWWPGDGNATDIVGGHSGTLVNGATFAPGKVGEAFSFDGNSARVEIPDGTGMSTITELTADLWVSPNTFNEPGVLLIKGDHAGGVDSAIYELLVENGQLEWDISNNYVFFGTGAPISWAAGSWHHVAAVWNGTAPAASRLSLYVDGVAVASGYSGFGSIVTYGQPLNIGGAPSIPSQAAGGFFNGLIDEVEIFDHALTQPAIQAIVDAGPSGKCRPRCVAPPSDMVAWWPLDETVGVVVHDIAGGNDGAPKTGPLGSGGPTPGAGEVAGALNFNGTSDYVDVPNAPGLNFDTGSLSIDAWIRIPLRVQGFLPIVDKEISGPTDLPFGYAFYVLDGFLGFIMSNDVNSATSASIGSNDTTINLADDNWHHVAVTVRRSPASATGGNLIIDGQTIATAAFDTTPFVGLTADNLGDVILGSRNRLGRLPVSDFFNGWMDEVEMFSRALEESEIQGIYGARFAGKCKCASPPTGMVAWWPLDETSGTFVADIAGYPGYPANNGTAKTTAINVGMSGPLSSPAVVKNGFGFCDSVVVVPAFVNVPDNVPLDFGSGGDFSIDTWIKTADIPQTVSAFQMIVDKLDLSPPEAGYRFYVDSTFKLRVDIGNQTFTAATSPALTPLIWYHVAVVVARASSVTFYINGVAYPGGGTTSSLSASSPTLELLIGATHDHQMLPEGCGYWLDEIEIFNVALQPSDVFEIFSARSRGKCKPACPTCRLGPVVPVLEPGIIPISGRG